MLSTSVLPSTKYLRLGLVLGLKIYNYNYIHQMAQYVSTFYFYYFILIEASHLCLLMDFMLFYFINGLLMDFFVLYSALNGCVHIFLI